MGYEHHTTGGKAHRATARRARRLTLALLLVLVVLAQMLPGWGEAYARNVYPLVAAPLSTLSGAVPFAVGDVFIALSIAGLLAYPFHARLGRKHRPWRYIASRMAEYLLWTYTWFYAAWGLNYSQADFCHRTGIAPAAYQPDTFERFARRYVDSLNAAYRPDFPAVPDSVLCREVVQGYRHLSPTLGIHAPFTEHPRVKPMLFSRLASMVGVSGSMGPFFCEFTVNADVPPEEYPATYAHELAHQLGIAVEAEANFYAYLVCVRSSQPAVRFSGYFSMLPHVLGNARRLLPQAGYDSLRTTVRPEVATLSLRLSRYWQSRYSPFVGSIQDKLYDLYLRGNKISNGQRNYSEAVGLLIALEESGLRVP